MQADYQDYQLKKTLGKYTLQEQIGQGQYGIIYKASVIGQSNYMVAVKQIQKKIFDLEQQQLLLKEKQIQRDLLHHPNIVELFDIIETKNNYYLIMQLCEGGNLKTFCQKFQQFIAESQVQIFAAQILSGVKYINDNRIIHRDLKPENILVHKENDQIVFKICDFGLSRKLEKGNVAKTMCGTPLFTSPEILNSDSYDFKVDLWSFGVIVFQLLTEKFPFVANSIDMLIQEFQRKID